MSKEKLQKSLFGTVKMYYFIEKGDELKKIGKDLSMLIREGIETYPDSKRQLTIEIADNVQKTHEMMELLNTLIPKYILSYVHILLVNKEKYSNGYPVNVIPEKLEDNFKVY